MKHRPCKIANTYLPDNDCKEQEHFVELLGKMRVRVLHRELWEGLQENRKRKYVDTNNLIKLLLCYGALTEKTVFVLFTSRALRWTSLKFRLLI